MNKDNPNDNFNDYYIYINTYKDYINEYDKDRIPTLPTVPPPFPPPPAPPFLLRKSQFYQVDKIDRGLNYIIVLQIAILITIWYARFIDP